MRVEPVFLAAALLGAPLAAQAPAPAPAQVPDQGGVGDLLVAPTRIVMENGQKVGEVVLSNSGSVPTTYRVSLVRNGMKADGSLVELPEPPAGTLDPASLFRYSPHQVLLQPGESQVVRIALRKPAELPDGEYQVHMQFMGLPPVSAPRPKAEKRTKGFSVHIEPVFAVSIPLIYRQGQLTATASISGLALKPTADGGATLHLELGRQGNRSIYGDLKAFFTPAGGAPQLVGEADGLAVYPSLPSRSIDLKLDLPPGLRLQGGRFTVSFVDDKLPSASASAALQVP